MSNEDRRIQFLSTGQIKALHFPSLNTSRIYKNYYGLRNTGGGRDGAESCWLWVKEARGTTPKPNKSSLLLHWRFRTPVIVILSLSLVPPSSHPTFILYKNRVSVLVWSNWQYSSSTDQSHVVSCQRYKMLWWTGRSNLTQVQFITDIVLERASQGPRSFRPRDAPDYDWKVVESMKALVISRSHLQILFSSSVSNHLHLCIVLPVWFVSKRISITWEYYLMGISTS